MTKYAVDLVNESNRVKYYKNRSKRPIPINSHSRWHLDLTYTDSLLAIF